MEPEAFVEELKEQMEAAYKEWDNARENQKIYSKQLRCAATIELEMNLRMTALHDTIKSFDEFPPYKKKGSDGVWCA